EVPDAGAGQALLWRRGPRRRVRRAPQRQGLRVEHQAEEPGVLHRQVERVPGELKAATPPERSRGKSRRRFRTRQRLQLYEELKGRPASRSSIEGRVDANPL